MERNSRKVEPKMLGAANRKVKRLEGEWENELAPESRSSLLCNERKSATLDIA